jgi:hypothetical protein
LNRTFPAGEREEAHWLEEISEYTIRRLRSRCRGLIELVPTTKRRRTIRKGALPQTVQFLHVTVREFMKDKTTWKNLRQKAIAGRLPNYPGDRGTPLTNPNIFLAAHHLQMMKTALCRLRGYPVPDQAKLSIATQMPLPYEHLRNCFCMTEFHQSRLPWNKTRSLAFEFRYFFAAIINYVKDASETNTEETAGPLYAELVKTLECILCSSFVRYYTNNSSRVEWGESK